MRFLFLSLIFAIHRVVSPVVFTLLVIFLSLILSLIITYSWFSWFGFVIFLIYIGGILVIFIYFASLVPNQKFDAIIFLTITVTCLYIFKLTRPHEFNYLKTPNPTREMLFLYSNEILPITLFLISFLFVIIIIVVKISTTNKIPIRPIL